LKRLEAAGLVTRSRDAADERRVLVALTPAGAALGARAAEVPRELACRVGDVALRDAREFEILSARLQTLVEALAEATGEAVAPQMFPAAGSGPTEENHP